MPTISIRCLLRRNIWRVAALTWAATPVHADTVDVFSRYQKARITRLGIDQALRHDTARLIDQLLADPGSPYSEPVEQPAFTNELDWQVVIDGWPDDGQHPGALELLRHQLGTTRARPNVDVTPDSRYRDPFIGANAGKASVDPDIFWHLVDLTGFRHSTKAAVHAIGMQILRNQIASMPDADRRYAMGVDKDVFDRVMSARSIQHLLPHDLKYLDLLAQHRIVHRTIDSTAGGWDGLPVEFRIARVAAAYRDAAGYVAGPPCTRSAAPHPRYGGMGTSDDTRPLCFVAATDRAVHRWYLAEAARQARATPPEARHGMLDRLSQLMMPLFVLLDVAAFLEIGEMILADDMLAEGSLSTSEADVALERAARITCPIE